ncbi:hypothetical protein RKE29_03430 [Streptomyces sp. B1866]|uniref:hypothetical protein n=1 Tax=Streptomyces sp. B1866 TaxID=3075431 RepID=UPI0028922540|nr:hypothetical protein [Streptomyces sp. B1866]MDT3395709.1 hypothetical protein [Streptomyces sp. B1866]
MHEGVVDRRADDRLIDQLRPEQAEVVRSVVLRLAVGIAPASEPTGRPLRGGLATGSSGRTREATADHPPGGERRDATVRRAFRCAGAGASGRGDIAERMEELLAGLAEGRDTLVEERGTGG